MPKIKRKRTTIKATFASSGTASKIEYTTIFKLSFVETIFKGLKALSALNPFIGPAFGIRLSKTQVRTVNTTIMKSRMLQLFFKYAFSPNTNPFDIILSKNSTINIEDVTF